MAGRGGKLHEEIISLLISDAFPSLWEMGHLPERDYYVSSDDFLIRTAFRVTLKSAPSRHPVFRQYPDMLFMSTSGTIFIEVGDYVPDKWPSLTVIHIGFTKHVTLINGTGSKIERDLVASIEDAVGVQAWRKTSNAARGQRPCSHPNRL